MPDTTSIPRVLLRIPEAAAALGYSRAFIYKLIAAGKIRTVTEGRTRRIPMAEVERIARGDAA